MQTDFVGLRVHSGCALEAESLLSGVIEILKNIPKPFKLRVTGHSQGGGVASLLAWALEVKYGYRVDCGFGYAPMRSILKYSAEIFNAEFRGRWHSIARQADVVPHVPPAFRYGTTGEGWFIDGAGKLLKGIPTPTGYFIEVAKLALRRRLPKMWGDHSIDKYLEDVEELAAGDVGNEPLPA